MRDVNRHINKMIQFNIFLYRVQWLKFDIYQHSSTKTHNKKSMNQEWGKKMDDKI